MNQVNEQVPAILEGLSTTFDRVLSEFQIEVTPKEIGRVVAISPGIARVDGLPGVRMEELVRFADGSMGVIFNLESEAVDVILLDKGFDLAAGSEVQRTGMVLEVPVGESLLGRVIDPLARPLDNRGPVRTFAKRPVERDAPAVMDRAAVDVPLQTGWKVVDALIPIGRGQRELILGDRQTGKTALALDTIINQKGKDVICIYCAIGQRGSAVAGIVDDLKQNGALEYSIVIVAAGEAPPGLQYIAPFAATTMAEYFMEEGRDVLIIYDDLSRHARTYREISLLMRRPPGREAFPGDIFYLHSRLLERAGRLRADLGGGSLTSLPIAETEAQNISAYIPTNLISITDGQIYLSPELFQKGILPAVDVGKSVSRVGGQAQIPAYRAVAGDLRLSYAQFEELEVFSRFSTRLDEDTRQKLERGQRVRQVLKQKQYHPVPVSEQVPVLLAVTKGIFDDLPIQLVVKAEEALRKAVVAELPEVLLKIEQGEPLVDQDKEVLAGVARKIVAEIASGEDHVHA
jgi:F-type H+/Na+-transporting ATPase subunit alpha